MLLRYIVHSIKSRKKTLTLIAFMALFILFVAIDSVFFRTISEGDGLVENYHVLETNTGSVTQLVVSFDGLKIVGKFVGREFPKKGDVVLVKQQKSVLLYRSHYIFMDKP